MYWCQIHRRIDIWYLIFDHVHVVVCRLRLLFSHFFQMAHQVWHIHPELLGVYTFCCGFTEGWEVRTSFTPWTWYFDHLFILKEKSRDITACGCNLIIYQHSSCGLGRTCSSRLKLLMLKVRMGWVGWLEKCLVMPAGKDSTISPVIFTTHLEQRERRHHAVQKHELPEFIQCPNLSAKSIYSYKETHSSQVLRHATHSKIINDLCVCHFWIYSVH